MKDSVFLQDGFSERITKIKFCGIVRPEDAQIAIDLGADYLGLIFVPDTPRTVHAESLKAIAEVTRLKARLTGVFQDQPADLINELSRLVPLHRVQLHGQESPTFCSLIKAPVWKAFSLKEPPDLQTLKEYQPYIEAVLLDWPKSEPSPVDWSALNEEWLEQFATLKLPLFLAGKLTPDNVLSIVKQFKPDGVDVCSGIESLPTQKDTAKMTAFIQALQEVSTI